MFRGWGNGSVGETLVSPSWGPKFGSMNKHNVRNGMHACNPSTGEEETGGSRGSLASKSSLVGGLGWWENGTHKEMSDIPENDTQGFPLAYMCTHTHMHEKAAYLVKISNRVLMKICHRQKHIVGVLSVLTRKDIQCIWEENIFRTMCIFPFGDRKNACQWMNNILIVSKSLFNLLLHI